jgi:hypothetical protein
MRRGYPGSSGFGGDPLSEKLRDVYAKLDWADKHIADLHSRIRAYFHSRPPAVSGEVEFDFDRGTENWSRVIFKPVDAPISLTIGDAAVNLRGALDYLAGVLVREEGNDPVAAKTQFPILERQGREKSGAPKPLHVKGGVSDEALKIIDAVQPYKTPGWLDHPLLFVENLSNINKHRRVPTGSREISDLVFTHPGIRLARYAVTLGQVRDDHAELIFTLTGAPSETETGSRAHIFVEHAEGRQVAPIKSLTDAAQFIREWVIGPIERTCI